MDSREDGVVAVGRIDRAAGKHVGASEERGVLRASQHEHFEAVTTVAEQNDRAREPDARGLALGHAFGMRIMSALRLHVMTISFRWL